MLKPLPTLVVLLSVSQSPLLAFAFGQTAVTPGTPTGRDIYEWITWVANLSLVLVGVVGIIVAVCTLLKIEKQTKATEEAATAARDGVKIAQVTLVSTFRPKLIVRSLSIDRDTSQVADAKPCRLRHDLVNVGGTVAHVIHSEVCVHYHKGWSGENASNTSESKEEFSLQPGEYKEVIVELGTEIEQRLSSLEMRLAQGVDNPTMVGEIFLTGRIEYRDGVGAKRRTAFHRCYNQATKRFSVVADPDYEYSD